MLDLISEVVLMQQFVNLSDRAIEGKYVFPMDENAAVCAFEVFVNGKRIVGIVKEKDQARKEYRQAIADGKKAFLLEEEVCV